MKYCIVYLATDEAEKYSINLTKELSEKFAIKDLSKRVPPHMTIKYPFETEDILQVEKRIEICVEKKTSFPITIRSFGRFENDVKTIFMPLDHSQKIDSLITECNKEFVFLGTDQKYHFEAHIPHISIARHLDKETSDKIFEYLNLLPVPSFETFFDNLTLLEFDKEVWKVRRIFTMPHRDTEKLLK